jgi:peptidoglycan pentaglycine glycine transferase (the first glycine)
MKYGLQEIRDPDAWSQAVLRLENPTLLQSWQWGAFKGAYGWEPLRLLWFTEDGNPAAGAQVLFRSEGPGLTMGYCPRGPLLNWRIDELRERVLRDLGQAAHRRGALFLKIDPALVLSDEPDSRTSAPLGGAFPEIRRDLEHLGWQQSSEQVQFKNTLVLDLRPDEDTLLADMKQKTRYNIRLAGRKGVSIRRGTSADLDLLFRMFAETSLRDGFAIREPGYYQRAWGDFIEAGLAQPLLAEVEGQAVAAIIVFRYADTAYYLYGMSLDLHRDKMPNYLLQWEAIRWAKEAGCRWYDLWGAPDEIDPSDPMYGVYRFKEGFGPALVETPGAWDLPIRPFLFSLYRMVMPRLLAIMRFIGRTATRAQLEN